MAVDAQLSPPKTSRRRLSIGRRLFYTHLLVALLVAFGLGAYLQWAAEEQLHRSVTARVTDSVTLASQALRSPDWGFIRSATDVGRPEYQDLVAQLIALTERNSAIRRALLVRVSDGSVQVVADSMTSVTRLSPGDTIDGLDTRVMRATDGPAVVSAGAGINAIAPVPDTNREYSIALSVAVDDIAGQVSDLRRNAAASFVVAVILALAMSVWLALSARHVLQSFAARFREIAEGQSGHRLELRADDEFSDLAVALEDMSARITQSQNEREGALDDLKQARDRLQEMVRERSAELEKLNIMLRSEIEQRCQLEAALAEAAATDTMTHLLNRRGMLEVLDHAAEQARRQRGAFTVVIGDIDHFKRINDQYGHQVGDQVLVALGRRLKTSLGHNDAAARWGGEEFLLLWPGLTVTEAEQRANALRDAIGTGPIFVGGPQVTVSFGIAEFTGLDTVERCVNRADKALYRAKQEGRNRVHVGV